MITCPVCLPSLPLLALFTALFSHSLPAPVLCCCFAITTHALLLWGSSRLHMCTIRAPGVPFAKNEGGSRVKGLSIAHCLRIQVFCKERHSFLARKQTQAETTRLACLGAWLPHTLWQFASQMIPGANSHPAACKRFHTLMWPPSYS